MRKSLSNRFLFVVFFFIVEINAKSVSRSPIRKTTKNIRSTASPIQCLDDECRPRLLSDVQVHSYDLEYVYKHVDDTTVQGEVTIDFTLKQPTKQLIYHAKRLLNLSEPKLYENELFRPVSMRFYVPNDYVSLRSLAEQHIFPANRYKLKQTFVVNLIDNNVGFYQGTFNQGNGTRGSKTFFLIDFISMF